MIKKLAGHGTAARDGGKLQRRAAAMLRWRGVNIATVVEE
jgi:hypothetical protein